MSEAPARRAADGEALVDIAGLVRHFDVSPPLLNRVIEGRGRAVVKAVDGIDFRIGRGETFSLVAQTLVSTRVSPWQVTPAWVRVLVLLR